MLIGDGHPNSKLYNEYLTLVTNLLKSQDLDECKSFSQNIIVILFSFRKKISISMPNVVFVQDFVLDDQKHIISAPI